MKIGQQVKILWGPYIGKAGTITEVIRIPIPLTSNTAMALITRNTVSIPKWVLIAPAIFTAMAPTSKVSTNFVPYAE